MDGVSTTLERQFGAEIQTSMDAQVLWFEWPRETSIDIDEIYETVIDGGMGLQALRLLGEWEFTDGFAQLADDMSVKFEYGGKNPGNGKWDVDVIGYADTGPPAVYAITEFKQPEVYQPE